MIKILTSIFMKLVQLQFSVDRPTHASSRTSPNSRLHRNSEKCWLSSCVFLKKNKPQFCVFICPVSVDRLQVRHSLMCNITGRDKTMVKLDADYYSATSEAAKSTCAEETVQTVQDWSTLSYSTMCFAAITLITDDTVKWAWIIVFRQF